MVVKECYPLIKVSHLAITSMEDKFNDNKPRVHNG